MKSWAPNNDDDAVWGNFNGDISALAGQTVYLLIEAADALATPA
ncbi:MAG: hypothetical protein R2911_08900 [Caldilineaceae bacterium]